MKNLIVTILLILISYLKIGACSCIGTNTVKKEIQKSHIVISGKVISKNTVFSLDTLPCFKFGKMRYELLLLTSFKGHLTNDTVSIITGFGHGDCGYNFEVGKEYIVYANDEINIGYGEIKKVPNTFETNICTRTCTLNNLELDLIRKYCRPQRTKGKSH